MKHTVTFYPGNRTICVEDQTTILQAAVDAGVDIGGNCGGTGSCGKCKVMVEGNCESEKSLHLSEEEYAQGYRMGCLSRIKGDLTVLSTISTGHQKIASGYADCSCRIFSPLVSSREVVIPKASLENNEADFERLRRALEIETLQSLPTALKKLPTAIESKKGKIKTLLWEDKLLDVLARNEPSYGLSIDIGTTTIALELIDLSNGQVVNSASDYNHQIVCGEDVVSRMIYEEEHGQERLTQLVLETINNLTKQFNKKIHAVSISGNTTMVHMLLGLNTHSIRFEPYVPVTNFPPVWRGSDIGLDVFPDAPVYIIPGCAGYVGGDITAGILASRMNEAERPSLLIDVGTNGEIGLGCKDWMLACSTSAGPSFEGGDVSCGMRGIEGAIDTVKITDGNVEYSVIGDVEPHGLCGSGIIDIVAQLFMNGIIDKKGRLKESEFHITDKIAIYESDVESIIRTKAAIFAGCRVLLDAVNLKFKDLDKIYIAGGFGNYLDIENAQMIGLLPPLAKEKFKLLGNASLGGAKLCLLSAEERQTAENIARSTTYIDLSSSNSFFEQYSSALFIPHTNAEEFSNLGNH
ncbi:ASKHA domain-containing protein [Candidatus Methanomassiliicoccus intestinalis]|uniref:ASKHA domain-containing protein n=1 Tax=Candidatus Methanomassiliicoccus intestinalis TaxID=1406512 RepID=UPI0037DCFE16